MRKFFMFAFAALALTIAAPSKASAAAIDTSAATQANTVAPVAPVSTKANGTSAFNDCYCGYRVRYYRVRYYRPRYYRVRYTYTRRCWC